LLIPVVFFLSQELKPGGTMTNDELTQQIAARVSAMWDAYGIQDAVRHNAFLADDYVAIFPDGTARAGKPTLQDIAAAPMSRYALSSLRAELLAPGVALVTYAAAVEGPSGGQIIHVTYSVGNVWVLRNGSWVNRYYQGTPVK
jgi:ketosteroid isomerase-like protein